MYLTFKNNSIGTKMIVTVENQKYIINPGSSVDIFCSNNTVVFETQPSAFKELTDMLNELDEESKTYSFKDKILAKLTKKFTEKLPESVLDISVKYEANFKDTQPALINLCEGMYSVCDGKIADFLDIMPIGFIFARVESENGEIRVLDATATNRKKFLKLMRNMLLFMHWGLIFVDLFFFIPEYLIIKYYSSHFYIKRLFSGLYNKPANDRARLLYEKEQTYEKEEKKKGCLSGIIKGLIILLILGVILIWGITNEPDVIISEDFSSVSCFEETFVKIDSGLPEDAEDIFLEDYSAYYTLSDGGYDMDNYYCYIYETPDGTRYMWVKDNCTDKENKNKDYEDYENPLVYKSIGKIKD